MSILKNVFSIKDIVEWVNAQKLELPSVQRSFVWKPDQIEYLWDSMLRGYPLGAIILSPKKEDALKYQIIDGQQRCTSICLGLADLSDKSKILNASTDNIRIFIDLAKHNFENDNRKYYIRVVTRSHPWGYKLKNNKKPLAANEIRKSVDRLKIDDHLSKKRDHFYPYDACCPLPLNILVNSNKENLEGNLLSWIKKLHMKYEGQEIKNLSELIEQCSEEWKIRKTIEKIDFYSPDEILETIQDIYDREIIPALYLDLDINATYTEKPSKVMPGSHTNQSEDEDSDTEDESQSSDEIEDLFIRINSKGTPISGEELTYSIFKNIIQTDEKLKSVIEERCKYLMSPSRFITIAYRLYQYQKREDASLQMKIKPDEFRREVKGDKGGFVKFLKKIVEEEKFDGQTQPFTLLDYIRSILEYGIDMNGSKTAPKGVKDYRFPYLLSSKIARTAPELMFILMYRIWVAGDRFSYNTDTHRRMLGLILMMMWLGDNKKLLSGIGPLVKYGLLKEEFWSNLLIESVGDTLRKIPEKAGYLEDLKEKTLERKNGDIWKDWLDDYAEFYNTIIWNKDVLLYAQRHFLSKWFNIEQYMLDDTNVPFDWDHISPANNKNKRGTWVAIKEIYDCNGNIRAWPYALNRADQDSPPKEKFNPDDETMEKIKNIPQIKRLVSNKTDLNKKELKKILVDSSFCDKKWTKFEKPDFTRKENCQALFSLITTRLYSLDKEIRESLCLDEIAKKYENNISIDNICKKGWKNDVRERKKLKISSLENMYFYIEYLANEENGSKTTVQFGLFEPWNKETPTYWEEKDADGYSRDSETGNRWWIFSENFDLICHHPKTYKILIQHINKWIKKLPCNKINKLSVKEVRSKIWNEFNDSLESEFQLERI